MRIQQPWMEITCFRYFHRKKKTSNTNLWEGQSFDTTLHSNTVFKYVSKPLKLTWGVDFDSASASLQKLLSMIDSLLSTRILRDNSHVSAFLDLVESSLRLIGLLIDPPGATRTSNYTGKYEQRPWMSGFSLLNSSVPYSGVYWPKHSSIAEMYNINKAAVMPV